MPNRVSRFSGDPKSHQTLQTAPQAIDLYRSLGYLVKGWTKEEHVEWYKYYESQVVGVQDAKFVTQREN